jgi:hypothetical protein
MTKFISKIYGAFMLTSNAFIVQQLHESKSTVVAETGEDTASGCARVVKRQMKCSASLYMVRLTRKVNSG